MTPDRVEALSQRETRRFIDLHPRSAELAAAGGTGLLGGVPMNWMRRWPGPFPVFVASASGATLTDVDGIVYDDFCLGDTGAMCGHSPPATVAAVADQLSRGITTMLPTARAHSVGRQLTERFGLPVWQIAMTATDANRFALRIARELTGRDLIVAFNWCYHGSLGETLAVLDTDGRTVNRPGSVGPSGDVASTTRIVEFNDLEALASALADGRVAAVLAEPALTNIGIVLPEPGFWEAVRHLCNESGTLLIIDETHTICAGPGGATAAWGLDPDLLTIGKPIAGGVPAAAFGMTHDVAARAELPVTATPQADISGVGGTLSGNALAVAAIDATLRDVLTPEAFVHMEALAVRWAEGVAGVISSSGLPWHVNRLGCRAEYWFCPPPSNGGAAASAVDHELENLIHLACMNRGILLTPFHNMALMSPVTTAAMVDHHTEAFAEIVGMLTS